MILGKCLCFCRQVSHKKAKQNEEINKSDRRDYQLNIGVRFCEHLEINSGMSATFFLFVFSFFGAALSAYPYHAYYVQPPAYPVQQAPQYLVYPHGVYQLTNVRNATHQVKGPDFVFGHKLPQDKLLLHTTVYKRPGIWSSYASKEITFPPPGSAMRVNITQVNARDRGVNATGGFVKLVRGGIGRENVTLLFRSQKNRPINFELDVYGVSKR